MIASISLSSYNFYKVIWVYINYTVQFKFYVPTETQFIFEQLHKKVINLL